MASKKNQVNQEVPIDRLEDFLNKNFKVILGGVAICIFIVLVVYLVYKNVQASKVAKLENLGSYEITISQNTSDDVIDSFGKVAEDFSKQKNYVFLKIAQIYVAKGEMEKAKSYLLKVDGNLKEFADSLLYDIGNKQVISSYSDNSKLSMIWDYRKALGSGDIKSFVDKYPDSNLAELLKNWES